METVQSILYRFQAIASYLSKVASINLSYLHLAPSLGWPHLNFLETFCTRKLASLCYRVALFPWFYV